MDKLVQNLWENAGRAAKIIESVCSSAVYAAPETQDAMRRSIAKEMDKITTALHLRRPGLSTKAREVLEAEVAKLRERFVSGEAGASPMLADAITVALSLLEESAP